MNGILEFLTIHYDWTTIFVIIFVFSILATRYYTSKDIYEKEPKIMLLFAVILGFLSIIPALVISLIFVTFFPNLDSSIFIAPVVEELSKGFFVLLMARSKEFDGPMDGLMYGSLIGIGFAAGENVLYAYNALFSQGFIDAILLTSFRSIVQILGHPFFTGVFGIGVGYYKIKKSKTRWNTIWQAMLFHGGWNLTSGIPGWYSLIGIGVLAIVYLKILNTKIKNITKLDKEAFERGVYDE